MNKEIALKFSAKLNKIGEIQQSIIEELRTLLKSKGEQSFSYCDNTSIVPIYYITDDNDVDLFKIDKIRVDSEDVIQIHDKDFDEWYRLSYLDNQAINTLIEYIDWK